MTTDEQEAEREGDDLKEPGYHSLPVSKSTLAAFFPGKDGKILIAPQFETSSSRASMPLASGRSASSSRPNYVPSGYPACKVSKLYVADTDVA